MEWQEIIGQKNLKSVLQETIREGRIPHAQLFAGREGYGTFPLALALAQQIFKDENPGSEGKVAGFNHLDLHFSFPVFTENKDTLSRKNFEDFRGMMLENPYASYEDWTKLLNSENKQLFISADEVDAIGAKFALKSFEGGTKILIVWRADKMNAPAANKFLKFLEEPPAKTLIILTAENAEDLLPTILSRCQLVQLPPLHEEDIQLNLRQNLKLSEEKAAEIAAAAQGDWNIAKTLATREDFAQEFEELFVKWVRNAFMVKKNPALLKEIISWSREVAGWNREKQKSFLSFSAEIFRLALLQNYQLPDLVYRRLGVGNFNWERFSQYIHGANIEEILEEISQTDYHLERNANAKIVWTDFGIKLTRYLHRKAS